MWQKKKCFLQKTMQRSICNNCLNCFWLFFLKGTIYFGGKGFCAHLLSEDSTVVCAARSVLVRDYVSRKLSAHAALPTLAYKIST